MKMQVTIAALISTTLLRNVPVALAQSPGQTGGPGSSTDFTSQQMTAESHPKSAATTVGVAAGGALLGLVSVIGFANSKGPLPYVGVAALVALPSAGRWYAGETGVEHIAVRTAGAVAMVGGAKYVCGSRYEPCSHSDAADRWGFYTAIAGAGVIALDTLWDVATSGRAAERYNSAHSISATPMVNVGNGSSTVGMTVTGQF
jgi:hypothetical protein